MKYKILITDDDAVFANNLARDIKNAGFDVRAVNNALDAEREMRSWRPHILLLDLVMPGKDGVEVLKEKSKDKAVSWIPVIMISESNDPKNIDMALSLGVRDYVTKANLDISELTEKIKLQLDSVTQSETNFDSTAKASTGTLSGFKVLWVEDDTYLSDIISRKLSGEGCKLVHAATGEEALELAAKEIPDIVLLDILLPGLGGFEVLERLKNDPKLKSIPVIMTSNLGQKEDIEKGEKLGAEKFLVKATVTLDEIIAETKEVLSRSKSAA